MDGLVNTINIRRTLHIDYTISNSRFLYVCARSSVCVCVCVIFPVTANEQFLLNEKLEKK